MFLGTLQSQLPKTAQQGTWGSCTGRHRLRGRGCRASKNRWVTVLAGNLGDLAGWSSLSLPQTLFLFIHSNVCSWSTLFLDPEYSAASHYRQHSDFSDGHFLCFPLLPHPGFPTTSLCSSHAHTPVSLALLFPPPNESLPFLSAILLLSFLLSCSFLSPFSGWRMHHLLHEAFLNHPTPQ